MKKSGKIFLLGFMGSGKSTLGKKVATRLNIDFIDLDNFIEQQENKTISAIFAEEGEAYFRKIEQNALEVLCQKPDNMIIALGGGTPCFFNNMELINNTGISIYLKYNSGILSSRLLKAKSTRPLIKNKTKEELVAFIDNMLLDRKFHYNKAQFVVENRNVKVEDILVLI